MLLLTEWVDCVLQIKGNVQKCSQIANKLPASNNLMFKRYLYCSIDLDHDLEQMTLAKYKKDETCLERTDIKNLSFCCYDLDLDTKT